MDEADGRPGAGHGGKVHHEKGHRERLRERLLRRGGGSAARGVGSRGDAFQGRVARTVQGQGGRGSALFVDLLGGPCSDSQGQQ